MTEVEKARLRNAEANVKALEKRLAVIEEEMGLCLKFMRVQAEKAAREKDPNFKIHENLEA